MRYSCVTVYKNKGSFWERYVYDKSYVRRVKKIKTKRGEMQEADSLTVRIFSKNAKVIQPGDKIAEGITPVNIPENALTVIEVSDNLMLKNAHIRVSAS